MINKKFALLSLLLLLVPACKKSRYGVAPASTATTQAPSIEKTEFDEELGAFVVKDDESRFSAAVAAQASAEEELTAANSEPTAGDISTDSAQYGLKNIYFDFNKYKINDLQPDQRSILEHDVKAVQPLVDKGYKISIEGHACNSAGSTEYNMMLSEDRARAVKDYFESKGVEGDISVVGYGASHLIVPAGDEKQQAPNRRVEIYAYPASEGIE
jgi:outer membrane protein OmpA-like peptidoglycan-associated protein